MMVVSEWSSSKCVLVLAVVVGCLGMLWPKIFLPMFKDSLKILSPDTDKAEPRGNMMHPRMLAAMQRNNMGTVVKRKENTQNFPGIGPPRGRGEAPKQTGAMGFVMPLYTVGIVIFFLYTLLKIAVRQQPNEEPFDYINAANKHFDIDPEYRQGILREQYATAYNKKGVSCCGIPQQNTILRKSKRALDCVTKDSEVDQLQKRLKETEAAMEIILRYMGSMSEKGARPGEKLPQALQKETNIVDEKGITPATLGEDDNDCPAEAEPSQNQSEETNAKYEDEDEDSDEISSDSETKSNLYEDNADEMNDISKTLEE